MGRIFFLLSKLIIGNTRGFIRGKTLATLNDIPASIDTYTKSQIDSKLNGKANTSHTHSISNISGLQNQLNNFVTESEIDSIIESYVPTISKLGNVVTGYQDLRENDRINISIPSAKLAIYADSQRTIAIAIANVDNMPIINISSSWRGNAGGDSNGLYFSFNTDGRGTVDYTYCYFL